MTVTTAKAKHGGHRPGAGRPSIEPGEPSVSVPIRMTVTQREKLKRLGGSPWVRRQIDEAKVT